MPTWSALVRFILLLNFCIEKKTLPPEIYFNAYLVGIWRKSAYLVGIPPVEG
jgi:hypothetical protein